MELFIEELEVVYSGVEICHLYLLVKENLKK